MDKTTSKNGIEDKKKVMTIYTALHQRDDTDRQCVSRKEVKDSSALKIVSMNQ